MSSGVVRSSHDGSPLRLICRLAINSSKPTRSAQASLSSGAKSGELQSKLFQTPSFHDQCFPLVPFPIPMTPSHSPWVGSPDLGAASGFLSGKTWTPWPGSLQSPNGGLLLEGLPPRKLFLASMKAQITQVYQLSFSTLAFLRHYMGLFLSGPPCRRPPNWKLRLGDTTIHPC